MPARIEHHHAAVVEVGRVEPRAEQCQPAVERRRPALVHGDGTRRPAGRHRRRPCAQHAVLARVDEPRGIGAAAAALEEAAPPVEHHRSRSSVDVHVEHCLATGSRVERARLARLVARPPFARRRRREPPRVHELWVDVRRAARRVGDQPVHDERVGTRCRAGGDDERAGARDDECDRCEVTKPHRAAARSTRARRASSTAPFAAPRRAAPRAGASAG
jgi:hypothetical protein